jgi:two-component system, NarL family, response regulator
MGGEWGNPLPKIVLFPNNSIAMALSVGESTVKSHVNRILSKLGVSDRTQAVIVSVKRGIVSL